jgi:predicted 2-oxoglutarate/Fe(II)-dependent dioxygenase YbiX
MSITEELAKILARVDRPGDFYAVGRTELLAPRIEIKGVGPIALPLLVAQAKQLIKAATRAPYGRGAETIVDTNVRRTWQIEGSRVAIGGKHWAQTLAGIVQRAVEGLGVTGPVTAPLYKLLIYDKGSFFVSHRDTEKVPGMFATLVLALPSQSEGGELVVRHKDREARLELKCDEPSEIAFAAFYADCVHEVLPVTAGCRATLVFNLVRRGKGAKPEPPAYEAEAAQVAALLSTWVAAKNGGTDSKVGRQDGAADAELNNECPEKIVWPLEHAYTPAELAFDKLKGTDAAVAKLLATAAPLSGCDLHLALLSVWESGSAEYSGSYRRRYRRSWHDEDEGDDQDEFEVAEVLDWDKSLSEWRRPDNARTTLGKLPLRDGEVSPRGALDGIEPDEEHFREATGNEGASFERTYSRATLVIWPSNRTLAVINMAGLEVTLPYLEDLIAKWQATRPKRGLHYRRHAQELAGHMLSSWPATSWYERSEPSETGRMFQLLARLGEPRLVQSMLERLIAQSGHGQADNSAILDALGVLSCEHAAERLKAVVEAHGVDALGACAALLRGALRTFATMPNLLLPAAEVLVAGLPGDSKAAPKDQWGRPRIARLESASLVDLVTITEATDPVLAKRAANHVLAWPKHFGLDRVVVPAVKRLMQVKKRGGPAFDALHRACVAHLQQRIAQPLEAPRDWARPAQLRCTCQHCSELSRYLADPSLEDWTLRAAQQLRAHVEEEIRRAHADVDCKTLRRGSPHSLICKKNQASYKRRVAQRKQDLAEIAVLRGQTPKVVHRRGLTGR